MHILKRGTQLGFSYFNRLKSLFFLEVMESNDWGHGRKHFVLPSDSMNSLAWHVDSLTKEIDG